jgi:hypothetical protein
MDSGGFEPGEEVESRKVGAGSWKWAWVETNLSDGELWI